MQYVIGEIDDDAVKILQEIVKYLSSYNVDKDFITDVFSIFYSNNPSLISPLQLENTSNCYIFESYLILLSKWIRLMTKGFKERSVIVSAIVIDELLMMLNPKIEEDKQLLNEIQGKRSKDISLDKIKRIVDNIIADLEERITTSDLIIYFIRVLTESESLDPFSEYYVFKFMKKLMEYPKEIADIVKLSRIKEIREIILEAIEGNSELSEYVKQTRELTRTISIEEALSILKEALSRSLSLNSL
ncbi:hypothetical protein SJAV_00380 [Sulfurisphaera javensis]|uniref:Uncharacterized protein n=1 Tax=Sulfurisphaera javensis TaxID=2049879 RepID=A0AAT9GMG4_9CREN